MKFKIEKELHSPDYISYNLYYKKGFFSKWKYHSLYKKLIDAEATIKTLVEYPKIDSVRYYDEQGEQEHSY